MSTSAINATLANTEGWTSSSNYYNFKISTRRTKLPRCEFNIDGLCQRMSYSMFLKLELADGFKYKLNKIENKWYRNSIVNEESQDEEKLIEHPLKFQTSHFWQTNGIQFDDIWSSTRDQDRVVVMKTLRLYKATLVVRDMNDKEKEFHMPTHEFITVSPPPASKRKATEDVEVQEPKVKRSKKTQDRGQQYQVLKPVNNEINGNFHEYQAGAQQQDGQAEVHHEYYENQNGFENNYEEFILEAQQPGVDQNYYYGNYEAHKQYLFEYQEPRNYDAVDPMFYENVPVMDVLSSENENIFPLLTPQFDEEQSRKSFEKCSEEEREILSEFLVL